MEFTSGRTYTITGFSPKITSGLERDFIARGMIAGSSFKVTRLLDGADLVEIQTFRIKLTLSKTDLNFLILN